MTLTNAASLQREHQINNREAELLLFTLVSNASDGACALSKKELAQQASLSVRQVNENLRVLRGLNMIGTRACSDGYLIILKERAVGLQYPVKH